MSGWTLAFASSSCFNGARRSRAGRATRITSFRRWGPTLDADDIEDLEDAPETEVEEAEEQILDQATVAELKLEIATLTRLEALAADVRRSGEDTKWRELSQLLGGIFTQASFGGRVSEPAPRGAGAIPKPVPSPHQKLVIFTERRDTLNYLQRRISDLLGRPHAVVLIHGGLGRDGRRKAQESFLHDPEVQVLLATDAAGEGINLQRAHPDGELRPAYGIRTVWSSDSAVSIGLVRLRFATSGTWWLRRRAKAMCTDGCWRNWRKLVRR